MRNILKKEMALVFGGVRLNERKDEDKKVCVCEGKSYTAPQKPENEGKCFILPGVEIANDKPGVHVEQNPCRVACEGYGLGYSIQLANSPDICRPKED